MLIVMALLYELLRFGLKQQLPPIFELQMLLHCNIVPASPQALRHVTLLVEDSLLRIKEQVTCVLDFKQCICVELLALRFSSQYALA